MHAPVSYIATLLKHGDAIGLVCKSLYCWVIKPWTEDKRLWEDKCLKKCIDALELIVGQRDKSHEWNCRIHRKVSTKKTSEKSEEMCSVLFSHSFLLFHSLSFAYYLYLSNPVALFFIQGMLGVIHHWQTLCHVNPHLPKGRDIVAFPLEHIATVETQTQYK